MSWGRVQHSNNTLHRTTHSQSHRGLSSWVKLRCRLSSVRCAGRFFLLKTKTKRPSHKETGTQRAQMLLKEAWEDPRYLLIFQRSWAYKGCCAFLLVGKNILFSSLLEKDIWVCGNSVWNTLPCNGVKLIYDVMHAHATASSFASASDQVSWYFFLSAAQPLEGPQHSSHFYHEKKDMQNEFCAFRKHSANYQKRGAGRINRATRNFSALPFPHLLHRTRRVQVCHTRLPKRFANSFRVHFMVSMTAGKKTSTFNVELVRTLAHRMARRSGSHGISYTAEAGPHFKLSFKRSTKMVWSFTKHNHPSNLAERFLLLSCVRCVEMLFDGWDWIFKKMVWMSKRCKNKFSRSATSVESSPTAGCKNKKNVEAQLSAVALLLLEATNQKASDAASSIEQSLQRVGRCRNGVYGPRGSQIHVLAAKAHNKKWCATLVVRCIYKNQRCAAAGQKFQSIAVQKEKKRNQRKSLKVSLNPDYLQWVGAECNTAITHYTAPHTLKVTVVCLPGWNWDVGCPLYVAQDAFFC